MQCLRYKLCPVHRIIVLLLITALPSSVYADYKIGVALPLHTHLGKQMLRTLMIATGDAHVADLILFPVDTKDIAAAAKELHANEVSIVIGPLRMERTKKLRKLLPKSIPLLSLSNYPDVASPSTFILGYDLVGQVDRLIEYLHEHAVAQLAVIAPDNTYGHTIANLLEDKEKSDFFLLSTIYYDPAKRIWPQIRKKLNFKHHIETIQALSETMDGLLKEVQSAVLSHGRTILKAIQEDTPVSPPPNTQFPTTSPLMRPPEAVQDSPLSPNLEKKLQGLEARWEDIPWEKLARLPLQELGKYVKDFKNNPQHDSQLGTNFLILAERGPVLREMTERIAHAYQTPGKLKFYGLITWATMPLLKTEPSLAGAVYVDAEEKSFRAFALRYQKLFGSSAPHRFNALAYNAFQVALAFRNPQFLQNLQKHGVVLQTMGKSLYLYPNGTTHHNYEMETIKIGPISS